MAIIRPAAWSQITTAQWQVGTSGSNCNCTSSHQPTAVACIYQPPGDNPRVSSSLPSSRTQSSKAAHRSLGAPELARESAASMPRLVNAQRTTPVRRHHGAGLQLVNSTCSAGYWTYPCRRGFPADPVYPLGQEEAVPVAQEARTEVPRGSGTSVPESRQSQRSWRVHHIAATALHVVGFPVHPC